MVGTAAVAQVVEFIPTLPMLEDTFQITLDGIDTMAQRKTDWKAAHPGATDAEADVALEEAFKKLDPEPEQPVQE